MNKDNRHGGEYGNKWNLGKPEGRPPQEVEKGEAPWKLNVGVERKTKADLESSIRAQVNTRTRLEREPPHKVEKGETPWKLKVGAEEKKWKKLGNPRRDQEHTHGMGKMKGKTKMIREYE